MPKNTFFRRCQGRVKKKNSRCVAPAAERIFFLDTLDTVGKSVNMRMLRVYIEKFIFSAFNDGGRTTTLSPPSCTHFQ